MTTPREKAAVAGRKIYRGKPCGSCGSTKRYVTNATCVACAKESSRRHRARLAKLIKGQD